MYDREFNLSQLACDTTGDEYSEDNSTQNRTWPLNWLYMQIWCQIEAKVLNFPEINFFSPKSRRECYIYALRARSVLGRVVGYDRRLIFWLKMYDRDFNLSQLTCDTTGDEYSEYLLSISHEYTYSLEKCQIPSLSRALSQEISFVTTIILHVYLKNSWWFRIAIIAM